MVTLAFTDLLDPREKAVLAWAALILCLAVVKGDGFIGNVGACVRALLAWKLMLAFGMAALYSTLLLWAASEAGLWHQTATKATIYWFLGTGVLLVGRAIDAGRPGIPIPWRAFLREALKLAIVVDFLLNFYVLPFLVEFVFLIPVVAFCVLTKAMAPHDRNANQLRPWINGVLFCIALGLTANLVVRVVGDPGGFFDRESAEDFLVAPAMSVALVPYLCTVAWYSRRELENLRRRLLVLPGGGELKPSSMRWWRRDRNAA